MKFLRERREIAEAINIQRLPVITFDVREPMRGYPDCYKGSKIMIDDGKYGTRCTAAMFGDEQGNEDHEHPWMYKKIILSGEAIMITSSFGIDDVEEMIEWSNARVVQPGETVIVYFRGNGQAVMRMMKVGEKINRHCSTVTTLVDIDEKN